MQTQTRPLISESDLARRVRELAGQLADDYRDLNPLIVGVLKGCFVFLADLVREMAIPLQIDFVRLASYRDSTYPTGAPRMLLELETPVAGRHVLIVDDIVDTGHSLDLLRRRILQAGPASVRICALLDKPSRRGAEIAIDYVGFTIPDEFVVGYGIDFAEQHRHLREIRVLEPQADQR